MHDQGRPFLVWVIFLVLMLLSAISGVSVIAVISGLIPPEIAQEMGYDRIRTIDIVLSLVDTTVYIMAAITLLMMRKSAFYLFTVALFLEIGSFVWMMADTSRAMAIGRVGNDLYPYVAMISVGVAFLLFVYALRLMLSERLT